MSSFDSSLVSSCPPLNYHSRAQNGGVAKGGAFFFTPPTWISMVRRQGYRRG